MSNQGYYEEIEEPEIQADIDWYDRTKIWEMFEIETLEEKENIKIIKE